jgi:predicted ferric reductase
MILVAMIITSIGPIRRQMFEVFYYLHIVFAAAFVVCTYYHSGWMVPSFAIVTIGVDWFIRLILMAGLLYPKTGTTRIMTETVVEFTFPKSDFFHYNPGQYIYIAIPEISSFQWHPFSIVSSPNEPTVKLYIRKRGTWTNAIHDLAGKKSQVSFFMEGPYGNLSVDLMTNDHKYRDVMLISGGIGSKFRVTIFNLLDRDQYFSPYR